MPIRRTLLQLALAALFAVLMALVVSACGGGERLPSESRAAKVFDKKHAKVFGRGAPYSCSRTNGDETVAGLIEDVDFVCTPLKSDGSKCGVGECAGFVVDFKHGKVVHYARFGGP